MVFFRLRLTILVSTQSTGMEIVCENANFSGSETDFEKKRKKSMGKEIRGTKSKTNMIHTNKKQGAQIQFSTEYPQNN